MSLMTPGVGSVSTSMFHPDGSLLPPTVLESEVMLLLCLAMGLCQAAGVILFIQHTTTSSSTAAGPKPSRCKRKRDISGHGKDNSVHGKGGQGLENDGEDQQTKVLAAIEAIGRVVDEEPSLKNHGRDAKMLRSLLPALQRLTSTSSVGSTSSLGSSRTSSVGSRLGSRLGSSDRRSSVVSSDRG